MERLLPNWINAYVKYTEGIKSPEIWRRWAAIASLSSVLQRRVWVDVEGQDQYANLYLLFVGPPGKGKSNAIKIARNQLLIALKALKLTPADITKAAFYDVLQKTNETAKAGGLSIEQSPLTAFVDEWSVFVEKNDEAFMSFLGDIYDNPPVREYYTKTAGTNTLEYPCFVMCGGVTLRQLRERFTEQSLEGGFPARIIMVYSEEHVEVPVNLRKKSDTPERQAKRLEDKQAKLQLRKHMIHDLEVIMQMAGEYVWEDDAADECQKWIEDGMPPVPKDPRLAHYCERRTPHITKLCLTIAAAKRNELVITMEDFKEGKSFLLEAERRMPKAVAGLGQNEHMNALKLARDVVEAEWGRTSKPVPEWRVRQEVASDVPLYAMSPLIESLIKMRWIRNVGSDTAPTFIPPGAKYE